VKRLLPLCLLFILGFCVTIGTVAAAAPLSQKEAIRLSLERNLAVQSVQLQYHASEAAITEAEGLYDPRLQLLIDAATSRDALNGAPLITSENFATRFNFSLLQKLPSGAEVAAGVNQRRDDNLHTTPAFDPSWRNEFQLSLTQPLLKGFGRMSTEEPILLAGKGRDTAIATLAEEVTFLVADLRSLFVEMRRARAILASRRASIGLAEQILAENQAKFNAGLLPPLDILEAEVALKSRQRELLDAEQAAEELRDRLAEQLNLATPPEVILDDFLRSDLILAEEADLAYALTHRPDLRRAESQSEGRHLEATIADERRRPSLDLVANYGQKGFADDYGQSLDQSLQDDLQNWSVGLIFNYSLGNRQALGEATRKKYLATSAQRDVERLREVARRELRTTHRQIRLGEVRLQVSSDGVTLAAEKLRNLLKRREVGLTTTRAVFEGESDLAQAQTDLADAEALYDGAITNYLRASGRLLEHEGIRFINDPSAALFFVSGPDN
jgi:outer membrane protein TolC